MAQPAEKGIWRVSSSSSQDPAPAHSHPHPSGAQPSVDALLGHGQKHLHQGQPQPFLPPPSQLQLQQPQPLHHQQQQQQQQQHQQQQQPQAFPGIALQPLAAAPQNCDVPASAGVGTYSSDDRTKLNGNSAVSSTVINNTHASVAHPATSGPPASPHHGDPRSDTQHNGDAPGPIFPDMSNPPPPPPGPGRPPMPYGNPASYSSAGAPYDTQHNGDTPGPIVPDVSNHPPPPPPGAGRLPVTYASQAPYSSASLPPAGLSPVGALPAGLPPNGLQPNGLPPGGMPPMPPYSYPSVGPYRSSAPLPSIQTLPHGQIPSGGYLGSHIAGQIPPTGLSPNMPYYGSANAHLLGYPAGGMYPGYPGAPHSSTVGITPARSKKEIKRRTKTGCMTCRKRRIKCDERQPTCEKCERSRRECLGYNPIFRQQHMQGPAAIQPSPGARSTAAGTAAPPASASTLPSSAPHSSQASYPPLPSTPQTIKTEATYDYAAAIDPALQAAEAAAATTTRAPRDQQASGDSAHLRAKQSSIDKIVADAKKDKMNVDKLIAEGGQLPLPSTSPPSAERLDEITKLYYEIYVPGLTLFFETKWYDFTHNRATAANPTAMLHNNAAVISYFSSFLQTIDDTNRTIPVDMALSSHLESYVVWSLARLPVCVTPTQRQQYPDFVPAEDDLWEARGRLRVIEALLSGETLEPNPLSPPPANNANPRKRELEFWYTLADYLLPQHASSAGPAVSARERCLSVMRALLEGRENRDLLYSIAVLREYAAHWDTSTIEQTVPAHLDEKDPRSKLAVATRFVRNESSPDGGTTNVIRHFAELAYRAFVRPGVNVDKIRARN
ncbi:hypothetical protein VTI74DRAFT_2862 [Chaetomium olivicolor]